MIFYREIVAGGVWCIEVGEALDYKRHVVIKYRYKRGVLAMGTGHGRCRNFWGVVFFFLFLFLAFTGYSQDILFEDTFDGDNVPLGEPWETYLGSWRENNGELAVHMATLYVFDFALYHPTSEWTDYTMECDFRHDSAYFGFIFRLDEQGNFYFLRVNHEEQSGSYHDLPLAAFYRCHFSGFEDRAPTLRLIVDANLAECTYVYPRGEFRKIRVCVQDNRMQMWIDNNLILSAEDTSPDPIASGGIGFAASTGCFKPCDAFIRNLYVMGMPRDIYVATTGDDTTGNGTSTKPYRTIQKGIDEALDGDSVLVEDGEYVGFGNVNLDFKGKAITVRSLNGAANCIIDCENVDGTRGFYFHNGEDQYSVLDGLTIQNGKALEGGGILCEGSSPTIKNCVIRGSWATGDYDGDGGGGILCRSSHPNIISNLIIENQSNCAVGAAWGGGGIACMWSSSPIIEGNIIKSNWAFQSGGGIACAGGSNPVDINSNIISENSAYLGGGISCVGNSPTIVNNVISDNSGGWGGGGIHCWAAPSVIIVNNTITGNSTTGGRGGGICNDSSVLTINNTILWSNSPQEIYSPENFEIGYFATYSISHSDIQGGQDGIAINNEDVLNWLEGNIDQDPLFFDAPNGHYHLSNSSPCIGAGTSDGAPSTDIEGKLRPNPSGSNPDMGAYENPLDKPEGMEVKITAAAEPGGYISPEGDIMVAVGADMTFIITPDSYHIVRDALVDGESRSVLVDPGTGIGTYTFTNVTSDHTIVARFDTKQLPHNNPPVAAFTWSPEPQNEGAAISFSDNSADEDGTVVSWSWDFGDWDTSTEQNPSHVYKDNGVYTVALTVTDDDNSINATSHNVTVCNAPPVVNAIPDHTININDTFNINASFTDPGISDTHTATIDWGDGSPIENIIVNESEGSGTVIGSHVYTTGGVYTAELTVIDKDDSLGSYTFAVIVNAGPVSLTVDAGADQSVNEGSIVTLISTFTNTDNTDTHTASIDWGDGTAPELGTVNESNGSGMVSATHVYTDNGTYTVTLVVIDDDDETGTDALIVTVSNVAPTVYAGMDKSVNEGESVSISAAFSDVGSSDTHVVTIDWGDGSPTVTVNNAISPVIKDHVYGDNGEYTVTVTVEDDDDGIGIGTLLVTVNNVAPTVDAGNDQSVNTGAIVSINATFADAGTADTHTATIDWGDNSQVEDAIINETDGNGSASGNHTYENEGEYMVEVTVVDKDGASRSDTLTINVESPLPEGTVRIDSISPPPSETELTVGEEVTFDMIVYYSLVSPEQCLLTLSILDINGNRTVDSMEISAGDGTVSFAYTEIVYEGSPDHDGKLIIAVNLTIPDPGICFAWDSVEFSKPVKASPLTISGHVSYKGVDEANHDAAFVWVEVHESDLLYDDKIAEKETDRYGNFIFTSDVDGNPIHNVDADLGESGTRDIYLKVFAKNSWVEISDCIHQSEVAYDIEGDSFWSDIKILSTSKTPNHAEAFGIPEYFLEVGEWFKELTRTDDNPDGWHRERVTVYYPTSKSNSQYDPIFDAIHFVDPWQGTAAHEYGHAIHKYLVGSLPSTPPGGHDDYTEYSDTIYGKSQAFAEGWAIFFHEAYSNRPRFAAIMYEGDLTRPTWMGDDGIHEPGAARRAKLDSLENSNGSTGEITEGAIARILCDIYDSAGDIEDDDAIEGKFHMFWEIFKEYMPYAIWDHVDMYPLGNDFYHSWVRHFCPNANEKSAFDEIFIDHGIPVIDDEYDNHEYRLQSGNDDCEHAGDIGIIQLTSWSQDKLIVVDPDWYKFGVPSGQDSSTQVSIEFEPSKGKLNLDVYRLEGENCTTGNPILVGSANGNSDQKGLISISVSVDHQVGESNIYLICVEGLGNVDTPDTADKYEGDFSPRYKLTIQNTVNISVDAGEDQIIVTDSLPAEYLLQGTVNAANPEILTITWSKISGPGDVTFDDPSSPSTSARFSNYGNYVLQLMADDPQLGVCLMDTVNIEIGLLSVYAGLDQNIKLQETASLHGEVTYGGTIENLTILWSKHSGPGAVTFVGGTSSLETTATFGEIGNYELHLSATDGIFSAFDTVSISVAPENTPPHARDVTIIIQQNDECDITLDAYDLDNDDLTYVIASKPSHGELKDELGRVISDTPFTLPNNSKVVTYIPDKDYWGKDAFLFWAEDGGTEHSNSAFVNIDIKQYDYPPTAFDVSVTAPTETTTRITLDAIDVNPDTLDYLITSMPSHGTLKDAGSGQIISSVPYTLSNHGKQVDYTPESGYLGSDSFYYRVNDGDANSNYAKVSITVKQGNRAPVAHDHGFVTTVGAELYIAMDARDPDWGDDLDFTVLSKPSRGTLMNPAGDVPITFVPYTLPYNDNVLIYTAFTYGMDNFTFRVSDGVFRSNVATINIEIGPAEEIETWPTEVIDKANRPYAISMSATPDGRPAVSYRMNVDGANQLRYAEYNATTDSWDIAVVDSNSNVSQYFTSLAFGPNGEPAIAYRGNSGDKPRYAYRNNGQWYHAPIPEPDSQAGHGCCLRFDPVTSQPVISYLCLGPDPERVKLARYNGASWNIETVNEGNFDYYNRASLEIDSSGKAHVCYYISYRDPNDILWRGIRYAHNVSGTWQWQMIHSANYLTRPETTMLSGSSIGMVHYDKNSNDDDFAGVCYMQCANGHWGHPTDIAPTEIIASGAVSIARAPVNLQEYAEAGQPGIACAMSDKSTHTDQLRYLHRVGGVWHRRLIANITNQNIRYVSIGYDRQGWPCVAFSDESDNSLRFAKPVTTLKTLVAPAEAGIIQKSPDKQLYTGSESVMLTAQASSGWQFSHWTGDVPEGMEKLYPLTIITDAKKSLIANFIQVYNLATALEPPWGGTVNRLPSKTGYLPNEEVQLQAKPSVNCIFAGWSGDVPTGHEMDNPLAVVMDQDRNITAHFKGSLVIEALCPIDLVVKDRYGRTTDKNSNTIPSSNYIESDLNGDGDLDDMVRITDPVVGVYSIEVVREPDAGDTDTFTLIISLNGASSGDTKIIVQNELVQNIPPSGYEFELAQNTDGTLDIVASSSLVSGYAQGSGWFIREDAFRNSFMFDVTCDNGTIRPGSYLKYLDGKTRMLLMSTIINSFSISPNTCTFGGSCSINNTPGHFFEVTVIDGNPDIFSVSVTGLDEFTYSSTGTLAGGDIAISVDSGVLPSPPELPDETMALQNYPNPFNPDTWIPFKLSEDSDVSIQIYDVTGHLIRRLQLGYIPAGYYVSKNKAVYWDGRNEVGENVASGVYFYRLNAGRFNSVKKMIILR